MTGVGVEVGYDMMSRGEPKPMVRLTKGYVASGHVESI